MAIIIKTLKNRKYAYVVSRRAKGKIAHTYLGPLGHKNVTRLMLLEKESGEIPKEHYWLFWDTDPQKIEIHSFSKYIIERVLEFGNWQAFRWLQLVFPVKKIIEVLVTSRALSKKSKEFWEVWFSIQ